METQKSRELTEEPLPVHHKSNIRQNTSICLCFMFITYTKWTANFILIDKLTVSPDTSTVTSRADWNAESGSFWIEAAID
jgi:hypothetical protein